MNCRSRTGQELQMKLYVGNLSKQVNDAQLNDLATPFGKLISANVATERSSGESKGFGFVEFTTAEEGRAAITGLDGKDVHGQVLKVSEAKPRNPASSRPPSRGPLAGAEARRGSPARHLGDTH